MRYTDVQVSTEVGVGEEVQMLLVPEPDTTEAVPTSIRTKVKAVSVYDLTVCEARSRNGLAMILVSQDGRGSAVFKYMFTDFAGEEQSTSIAALFRFTPDRKLLYRPYFTDQSDLVRFGYALRGEREPC